MHNEAIKKRKGDFPCQKLPNCPFVGCWRKDTKTAGGGKGWCIKCLFEEEGNNKKT